MKHIFALLLLVHVSFFVHQAYSQVLDVNDPIVTYDPNNPPPVPNNGVLAKWVITPSVSWNADRWKSYVLNGIAFRLRFPNNYDPTRAEKYPMIVILHGIGFRDGTLYMNDRHLNNSGAKAYEDAINAGKFDGFVLSPQSTNPWFNEVHINTIDQFISKAKNEVNIDVDRVSINGRSGGAQQVWLFIQQRPQTYAAAAPMSGVKSTSTDNIDTYKHIPLWLFQGALDNGPTPYTTEGVISQIVAKGGNVTYTKYKNGGHGIFDVGYAEPDYFPFYERAHKANPTVLNGTYAPVFDDNKKIVYQFLTEEQPCPEDAINVSMGLSPGFDEYQWRKDGILISGATDHEYTASSLGVYEARFRRGSTWSVWSPRPIEVKLRPATETPDIAIVGEASRVLPTLSGETSVLLELPQGYASYEWRRVGSTQVVGTERTFEATQPGQYIARVIENLGCSSNSSQPFTVINANAPNGPADLLSSGGVATSQTDVRISWSSNPNDPNPATGYELYRSSQADGPFSFIALINAGATEWTDSELTPNTTYYYQLRAVNQQGASKATATIPVKTQVDSNPPSAPTNLIPVEITPYSVSLDWEDATDDSGVIARYDIYRDGIKVLSTENSEVTIYNLQANTTYEFKIKAKDQTGNESPFSNRVLVTPSFVGEAAIRLPLDGNVTDASVNATDARVVGSVSYSSTDKVEGSASMIFSGNGAYVDVDRGNQFVHTEFAERSVAFWLKRNTDTNIQDVYDEGGSTNGLGLRLNTTNLEFAVRNGKVQRTLSAPFPLGSWHHVVAVYNQRTISLYIDGTSVATDSSVPYASVGNHSDATGLGGTNGGNAFDKKSNSLNGAIDNFHLYTTALSEEQIAQLAESSGGPGELVAAPENVVATALTFSAIRLTWDDKSDNEVEFQVYRARNGGGFTPIALVEANSTQYLDSGVVAETSYSYRVVALGAKSTSEESAPSPPVTTPALPTSPAAPGLLEATDIRYNQITIAFTDNSTNEDYFEILRAVNTGQNFQSIKKLTEYPEGRISYTDEGLETNIRYLYKVVAVNAGGLSESEVLAVTTRNRAPELTDLADLTIRQGESFELAIAGSDADGDALAITAINLPAFAELEDNGDGTGRLRFTPSASDEGEFPGITIVLQDSFGGADSTVFTVTVNNNAHPQLAPIADITMAEGEQQTVELTATDEEGTENLTWESTGPAFASLTSQPDGSARLLLRPGFTDQGDYSATVSVTDANGATATQSFAISVTEEDPNTVVRINFTEGGLLGGGNWNNTSGHPAQGDTYPGLVDQRGSSTNFSLTVVSNWRTNGANALGASTGNNSGIYPDNVLKSAYWTDGAVQTLSLEGLDDTRTYTLTFLGSRAANDNRTTVYTVGTQSVTLNAAGNTQETVSLRDLSPDAGVITFTISSGGGSTYGYLNALIVEETFKTGDAPAVPTQVTATLDEETSQVIVRWKDVAFDEAGYRIYKTSEEGGAFEQVADLSEVDVSVYRDSEVASNTTYFYRVRAYNANGESADSETVSVTVPNVAPRLEAIGNIEVPTGTETTITVNATDDAEDVITLSGQNLPVFATLTPTEPGSALLRINPSTDDVGTYNNVKIQATDQLGEQSETVFSITVQPAGLLTYRVNFAGTNDYAASAPWNNYVGNGNAGDVLSGIQTESEEGALLSLSFQNGWNGANSSGMVGSSVYPDKVTRSALWIGDNQERHILIQGLPTDQAYDFTFFASRDGAGNRVANYSINGTQVSLNASYNQNESVQIEGAIPNSAGELMITISRAAGASYGYLNALIIESYPAETLPSTPSQLTATPGSNQIRLTWQDNAIQEAGYEIWRSLSRSDGYSLLHTTAANIASYTNEGVSRGTTYYYKVRTVLDDGSYSDFSAVASASPVNATVSVNFNVTDPQASPWNNTNAVPEPGLVFSNLINERGNSTGISFEIVAENPAYDPSLYGFSGDNPFGVITGDNSGAVPDNVMRSTYWMDPGKTAELRFFDLDLSQRYNFRFFASRDGAGNRTTVYSINGESVKLNAAGNTSQTVQLNNVVPDSNGEVIVSITSDAGSSFAYLGAIIIESSNRTGAAAREGVIAAKVETVEDVLQPASIVTVYPNPYDGITPLQIDVQNNQDESLTIRIYNTMGSLVYEQQNGRLPENANITLDWNINEAGSGLYILYVSGDRSGTSMERILKR